MNERRGSGREIRQRIGKDREGVSIWRGCEGLERVRIMTPESIGIELIGGKLWEYIWRTEGKKGEDSRNGKRGNGITNGKRRVSPKREKE